nr:MAG TPA: hypothetical protein [Inoviridae sp.]
MCAPALPGLTFPDPCLTPYELTGNALRRVNIPQGLHIPFR